MSATRRTSIAVIISALALAMLGAAPPNASARSTPPPSAPTPSATAPPQDLGRARIHVADAALLDRARSLHDAPPASPADAGQRKLAALGRIERPAGADPMLASSAGSADEAAWDAYRRSQASRAQAAAPSTPPTDRGYATYHESEAATASGANDTVGTAEVVTTANDGVDISGAIPAPPPPDTEITRPTETVVNDDGDITKAVVIAEASGPVVAIDSYLGDGPYGESSTSPSGDFDHYAVTLTAGSTITIEVRRRASSILDPAVVIYASDGTPLAAADDTPGRGFETWMSFTAPADGTYYLSVTWPLSYQLDPADSSTGIGVPPANTNPYDGDEDLYDPSNPALATGEYRLVVQFGRPDIDLFALDLSALGLPAATLLELSLYSDGPATVAITDADQLLQLSSIPPGAQVLPAGHPVAADAFAALPRVVDTSGTYFLAVLGPPGSYTLRAGLHRQIGRLGRATPQTVFLDFDGHRLTPAAVFGGPRTEPTDFTPLATFLPSLGLSPDDLDAVVDATITRFVDAFDQLAGYPLDLPYRIRVRNSRDHADPGDDPDVTRIVIGGTQEQLGVPTIGLAQSIDIGNFVHDELAVVLLDTLFGYGYPSGQNPEDDPSSLRYWSVASDNLWPAFAGHAIGSIAAHEAGHVLGSHHTDLPIWDPSTNVDSLMDSGGDVLTVYGMGDDGVYGTADDERAQFVTDALSLIGPFAGVLDTALASRAALAFDPGPTSLRVLGGDGSVSQTVADLAAAPLAGPQRRLAGVGRYETAAAIVADAFPGTEDVVYIATGESYPDALAGAAAAARLGAPVLLVQRAAIPNATQQQLARLKPRLIKLLGGANTITPDVRSQLAALTGATVDRIDGINRYETAARIVRDAFPNPVQTVYIATGEGFPDALAGAAAAAHLAAPVLLVLPGDVPAPVEAELIRLRPKAVKVLGGTNAVSDATLARIGQITGLTPQRIRGDSRYETAAAIVADAFPDTADTIYIATGLSYPDALAGAAAAAVFDAPVLLVLKLELPEVARQQILRLGHT